MANRLNPAAAVFVLPNPSERLYAQPPPMNLKMDLQKRRLRECRPTPTFSHPLPPKPPPPAVPFPVKAQRATGDGCSAANSSVALSTTSSGRKSPRKISNAAARMTRRPRKWTWQQHRDKFFGVLTDLKPCHVREPFLMPISNERSSKEIANDKVRGDLQQGKVVEEKLSKRILQGKHHRWSSKRNIEKENYHRFRWGSKKLKFRRSPFIPQHLDEYLKHTEEYAKDQAARYKSRMATYDPKAPKVGVKCMGGKNFETGESAVLAIPTIWSPSHMTMARIKSDWPSYAESVEEGYERVLQGYQRRFPIPGTKEFQTNTLLYPGYHNHLDGNYATRNYDGQSLLQEQQAALGVSQLDLVGGEWIENVDKEATDEVDEFDIDAEASLIGRDLSRMLRCLVLSGAGGCEEQPDGYFKKVDEEEKGK